jgi:hypothetical protein
VCERRDPGAVVRRAAARRRSSRYRRGPARRGEHVGWTASAHAAFARTLERWDLSGPWRLATLAHALRERGLDPYDRAAIEMAAIELALRQRGTTLATLAGVTPQPVRTVVSFERVADPAAVAAGIRAFH